ncbi:MAG: hypothetical protein DRO99_03130 [Candidatus Aenigmatarchaeota archaeon]|nr:MAG: hypothetical protein DRO99_03130 [Candidatus Aenigmarchaeota archaeon]
MRTEEKKVTLDKGTFRALTSDTRIGILKSLKERRKTLSELSKQNRMSVSTIKGHLDTLVSAGLIEQKDDGHKWKYYDLTRKGSAVLDPDERKVWILLSVSGLALLVTGLDAFTGVIGSAFRGVSRNAEPMVFEKVSDTVTGPLLQGGPEAAATATNTAAPFPWVHLVTGIMLSVLTAFFAFRLVRRKSVFA